MMFTTVQFQLKRLNLIGVHISTPAMYMRAIVILLTCGLAFARPILEGRVLLATPSNCTPPRTIADTRMPFCFVPSTISPAAQQFLATTATGATFGAVRFGNTTAEQAAAVAQLRSVFPSAFANLSAAAEAQYIGSKRNTSIGGVPAVIAVPKGVQEGSPANTKVLLYLHGGGYALGACNQQLNTVAATAAAANLTIICPDYRLAPEHPFPAWLRDALAVYKDLLKQGYQGRNIVLLGDSAGGGMVPALAIQLQREGVALPAALGMFSPYADVRSRGDTMRTMIGIDPVLPGAADLTGHNDSELEGLAAVYLGNNASNINDPLASPVEGNYVQIFANQSLPPTLIQVGLRETLLSDAVRLYHKMKEAAPAPGHVVLSPYEGMWHVFQGFFYVPEAQAASKEMAAYFTRALNGHICK